MTRRNFPSYRFLGSFSISKLPSFPNFPKRAWKVCYIGIESYFEALKNGGSFQESGELASDRNFPVFQLSPLKGKKKPESLPAFFLPFGGFRAAIFNTHQVEA